MSLARLRALVVLGVLAVAATVTVVWAIAQDSQESPKANECRVKGATTVPEPGQVKVRVRNGTDVDGLARTVGDELTARGFNVVTIDTVDSVVEGPAEVRYGPLAAGSAKLVRSQIAHTQARPDHRKDDIVELVIGPDFDGLDTVEAAAATLKKLGDPPLPSPKCD